MSDRGADGGLTGPASVELNEAEVGQLAARIEIASPTAIHALPLSLAFIHVNDVSLKTGIPQNTEWTHNKNS